MATITSIPDKKMKRTVRIVTIINHVDSLNLGDASLLLMSISIIKRVYNPEKIFVLSFNIEFDKELISIIDDHNVVFLDAPARPFKGSKLQKAARILDMTKMTILAPILAKKKKVGRLRISNYPALDAIAKSDIIVHSGGDNIADTYGFVPLLFQLHNIILAKLFRKTIVMFGNSIGPLRGRLSRLLAIFCLRKIDQVVVRDEKSLVLLSENGIPKEKIHFIPDLVFDLPVIKDEQYDSIFQGEDFKYIGIGVSGLLSHRMGTEKFANVLANLCDEISEKHHARIIFISHVLSGYNDLDIAKVIIAKMNNKNAAFVIEETNPMKIKHIVSRLDLLISFRMHPLIHALSTGVPVIGIDYNEKTKGLLKIFDKERWALRIDDIEGVGAKIDEYFAMRRRDKNFYMLERITISDQYERLLACL